MRFKIDVIGDLSRVRLSGHIDEDVKASLAALDAQVRTPRVLFDCHEIGKINSIGLRNWIVAFDLFDQRFQSAYERCTTAFVDMAGMVPSFVKARPIHSFYTCFTCDPCKVEVPMLVELRDGVGTVPQPVPCARCGAALLADDDLAADLTFLSQRVQITG
jgi:hypothetical protein